jgi:hypothetical protein
MKIAKCRLDGFLTEKPREIGRRRCRNENGLAKKSVAVKSEYL